MASSRNFPSSYNTSTYGDATRDYTSLATWEAATDTDLVTATDGEVLECYADSSSFSDYVAMAGATTNSSYFRVICAADGEGHKGTPSTGVIFSITSDNDVIDLREDYCRVFDLVGIVAANSSNTRYGLIATGADYMQAVGCIFKATNSGSGVARAGIFASASEDSLLVNCLFYEAGNDGLWIVATGNGTVYCYNCTVVDSGAVGFQLAGDSSSNEVVLINCLGENNGTNDFAEFGVTTESLSYCASGDATSDDWGGTGNRINQTFTFVNASSDNYHLAATDAGARGYGTDLSSDSFFAFDDDVDHELRSDWDIGFDEQITVSSSSGSLTIDGENPGISVGTSIFSTLGALSIVGKDSNISVGTDVDTVSGVISVSGVNPAISIGQTLLPNVGGLDIAGINSFVSVGINIDPNLGALSIIGFNPDISVGQTLLPGVGVLGISGINPNLSVGIDVDSTAGAISIAALNATVDVGVTISTNPGVVEIIGVDPSITAGTLVEASTGIISIVGNNTTVDVELTVNCNSGAIEVAGENPSVYAGATIDATIGALSIQGNDATVDLETIINSTTGSVEILGINPNVSSGTNIDCNKGGVDIVGFGTTVAQPTTVSCNSGSLEVSGKDASIISGLLVSVSTGTLNINGFDPTIEVSQIPTVPLRRIYAIDEENRIYAISAEDRTYSIT